MRIILNGSVCTVKRLRVSLGTLVAIEATADATEIAAPTANRVAAGPATPDGAVAIAEAAIERAFAAIEQVNRRMHPRADGSDLARINGAPLHAPTKVHASVGQLLNLARRINMLTEGVFDPCTPAQPGRLDDIEISADETEVVCRKQVALDFGGFAKGYAVDCAIEALMAAGCTVGLVNAGGDLRVFGHRTEPVFVRGPQGELTNIKLADAALAVSDAAGEQRPPEHQGYYVRTGTTGGQQCATMEALVERNPGAPAVVNYSTTYAAVIASTAAVADALAKCVLMCPPPAVTRVLAAFGASQPLAA